MSKKGNSGDVLRCSFCNKSQRDVKMLIAGPRIYICDECVDICVTIIAEHKLSPEFDGKPVQNLYDFTYALRSKKVGDIVPVVVKRNGQDVKVNVTLEARR